MISGANKENKVCQFEKRKNKQDTSGVFELVHGRNKTRVLEVKSYSSA
jgi:hypothetical protein